MRRKSHHIIGVMAALVMALVSIQSARAASPTVTGQVNINTASVAELAALPGIGKAKAEAIVTYRQTSKFQDTAELMQVKGIGKKMFAKVEGFLTTSGTTTLTSSKKQPTAGGR